MQSQNHHTESVPISFLLLAVADWPPYLCTAPQASLDLAIGAALEEFAAPSWLLVAVCSHSFRPKLANASEDLSMHLQVSSASVLTSLKRLRLACQVDYPLQNCKIKGLP